MTVSADSRDKSASCIFSLSRTEWCGVYITANISASSHFTSVRNCNYSATPNVLSSRNATSMTAGPKGRQRRAWNRTSWWHTRVWAKKVSRKFLSMSSPNI